MDPTSNLEDGVVFVSQNSSAASSTAVEDVFLVEKASKTGIDVFGFLLLSGFGPDPNLIVHFVGCHLLPTILDSIQLEQLLERLNTASAGTKRSNLDTNALDGQMGQLLTEAFNRVDQRVYELMMERLVHETKDNEWRNDDCLVSGCSAILALLVGSRLWVANCGSQKAIYCKEGTDGLSTICLSEGQDRETHCFGNYERKAQGRDSLPLPAVQPHVQLMPEACFLLFASPQVWNLFQRFCPENQSLDGAVANAVAEAIGDPTTEGSHHKKLSALLAKLLGPEGCQQNVSMAWIDLRQNIFLKAQLRENEQEEEESDQPVDGTQQETVKSEVDWSEFETHHLKEEVLAKVDSLRQLYRDRRNLHRISEDF